jgi:murein DD-endopeptidase MepM/ murein hydrolase activator NlpD
MYRMRFFVGGLLVILGLLLLPIMVSFILPNPKAQAANIGDASYDPATQDSPNIITSGMFDAADGLSKGANSAQQAISNGVNSAADSMLGATVSAGRLIGNGVIVSASFTAHAAAGSASFATHRIGSSVDLIAQTTGSVFGAIADTKAPAIGNVIRPSDSEYVEVINNGPPPLPPSTPIPAAQAVAAPQATEPQVPTQWPIHGAITTEFGASDWPYQTHHTGIDIADGNRSGTTPIHPFKPGKIIQVIHSSVSLGNHVVVDNGNGITSVYGHMYKTNVQVGQQVDNNSVLGWEGSTGASTGPHVHFEIYLNGVLQNPHNYVPGHP